MDKHMHPKSFSLTDNKTIFWNQADKMLSSFRTEDLTHHKSLYAVIQKLHFVSPSNETMKVFLSSPSPPPSKSSAYLARQCSSECLSSVRGYMSVTKWPCLRHGDKKPQPWRTFTTGEEQFLCGSYRQDSFGVPLCSVGTCQWPRLLHGDSGTCWHYTASVTTCMTAITYI